MQHDDDFSSVAEHSGEPAPLVELYISMADDQQNTLVEELLASVDLDVVVTKTLEAVQVVQPVMLTLLVTDDDGIRDMNKQYREQDKPTDVLSFPLLEQPLVVAPADQLWTPQITSGSEDASHTLPEFVTPPGAITNLGDIVMSWPTLTRQAEAARHTPVTELLYLLSHGVLHLVGYDDHSQAGYEAMVNIQQRVLESLGYSIGVR